MTGNTKCCDIPITVITSELRKQTAGTPRLERLIEYMLTRGFPVEVINTGYLWSTQIHQFNSIDDFYIYKKIYLSASTQYKNGSRVGCWNDVLRKCKHFLFIDMLSPAIIILLVKFLIKKKTCKNILASSPSFGNVFSAYFLKCLHPNTFFWCDMRDEWAMHKYIFFHKKLRKYIEKKVFEKSNLLTVASAASKNNIDKAYGINKAVLLYNVSTKQENSNNESMSFYFESDVINLLYLGTMPDGYYNDELFISFVDMIKDRTYRGKRFTIHFVGFSGKLSNVLSNKKYSNLVIFHPAISHSQALLVMKKADVLLFFGVDWANNGGIVPAKLLEYITSGTPILPFSIKNSSDVDFIFKKTCKKSLYINNLDDLMSFLNMNAYLEQLPCKQDELFINELIVNQQNVLELFLQNVTN